LIAAARQDILDFSPEVAAAFLPLGIWNLSNSEILMKIISIKRSISPIENQNRYLA
jgi:hypothetical protein